MFPALLVPTDRSRQPAQAGKSLLFLAISVMPAVLIQTEGGRCPGLRRTQGNKSIRCLVSPAATSHSRQTLYPVACGVNEEEV